VQYASIIAWKESQGKRCKSGSHRLPIQHNWRQVPFLSSENVDSSDGISMGTTGMRYSLQSRDIIADSIETVTQGQWYDANISLVYLPHLKFTNLSLDVIKIWLISRFPNSF
jgi:Dehydratase family